MSRRLRYIPEGGALVEVTCRTIHSRFLLRPSPELNDIVVGVLARAQRIYPIRLCAFAFPSNHFLCAAAHKKCYVEFPVMWSWRPQRNGYTGNEGCCCT